MGTRIKSRADEWARKKKELDDTHPTYLFKMSENQAWREFSVGADGVLALDNQEFMKADDVLKLRDWLNATFDETTETPAPQNPGSGNK